MPRTSADDAPVVEEAPPAPARWELQDEFHLLMAQGNPNPARLAELKTLLAAPPEGAS